jgi:anti-sigma B factor antagonist
MRLGMGGERMKPRFEKDVAILAPHGWLMGGTETDMLEMAVKELLEHGNRSLVLDLAEVNHLNSSALGALVGFHMSYLNREGRTVLCGLDRKIQNILVVTKLSLVFDVYPDERAAIASFATVVHPR